MSKKFKFASAVLSASLLVTPVSGVISQYNNVAKASDDISIPIDIDNGLIEMYDGWANNNGAINLVVMDYEQCQNYIKYYDKGEVLYGITKGVLFSFVPVKGLLARFGMSAVGYFSSSSQSLVYKTCKEAVKNKKNYVIVYVYLRTGNYGQYWFEYVPRVIYG